MAAHVAPSVRLSYHILSIAAERAAALRGIIAAMKARGSCRPAAAKCVCVFFSSSPSCSTPLGRSRAAVVALSYGLCVGVPSSSRAVLGAGPRYWRRWAGGRPPSCLVACLREWCRWRQSRRCASSLFTRAVAPPEGTFCGVIELLDGPFPEGTDESHVSVAEALSPLMALDSFAPYGACPAGASLFVCILRQPCGFVQGDSSRAAMRAIVAAFWMRAAELRPCVWFHYAPFCIGYCRRALPWREVRASPCGRSPRWVPPARRPSAAQPSWRCLRSSIRHGTRIISRFAAQALASAGCLPTRRALSGWLYDGVPGAFVGRGRLSLR